HALERIADRRRDELPGEWRDDLGALRRDVLTRSIFGVDVNPTAVWLCQLRLWLSVVIETAAVDPSAVLPLPNLDRNIRAGDALAGMAFADGASLSGGAAMRRLRQRYATACGARKESLGRALDRAERERALAAVDAQIERNRARRRELVADRRMRDLFG